jgi:nucleoside-diphosphate-sugar epimerase
MAVEKRKILVTGANGFVGTAVVSELQNAGAFEVFGLVGKNAFVENDIPKRLIRADIREYETLKAAEVLENIEYVVHTAGLAHQFGRPEPEEFRKVNVRGTENVCRLARRIGAGHFILASSVAVYGDYGNSSIDEDFVCRPEGIYAESKLEAERIAREFCEKNNIGLTILRLATVIGEGDRGNTARLITSIDSGRFLFVGKGANKKSLISKKDVARGVIKIIEKNFEDPLEIYNLTAEPVSMKEVVGTIYAALGKKAPRFYIPEGFVRGLLKANKRFFSVGRLTNFERTFGKWVSNDIFAGGKFNEKFGFRIETEVSEALVGQVMDYRLQKNKSSE